MKLIKLYKNSFAKVDDEDFEWINDLKNWQVNNSGYAQLNQKKYGRSFLMHRLVMFAKKGENIDHVNGNKLDNQKSNLRIATHSENGQNRGKQKGQYSSKYKGVTLIYQKGTDNYGKQKYVYSYFKSTIKNKNTRLWLGSFKSEHQAALMYDFWALEIHGRFAKPNFKIEKHNFF